MKILFKRVMLLPALLLNLCILAQDDFKEGRIVYEMSYPGAQFDAQTLAMLPTETTWYIKGEKVRMEQKMAMGMSSTTVVDGKAKEGFTLMDMMGNKTVIKMSAEQMKKMSENAPKPNVKLSDETKTIAGYVCKKADVTDEKGNKSTVYYTQKIKARINKGQTGDIDGFPLEFQIKTPQLSILMTATKLVSEKVDDSYFTIPPGYEEKSLDDFQKSLPGMH